MRMINDHTSSKLWCSRLTIPKTCSYFRGANYCNRSRYKACFLGAPLSLKCSLSKHFRLQVHPYPTWRRLTLGAPGLSESGIPQITDSTGVLHGWIVVNQSDFWNFFLACSVSCIDFFIHRPGGFQTGPQAMRSMLTMVIGLIPGTPTPAWPVGNHYFPWLLLLVLPWSFLLNCSGKIRIIIVRIPVFVV